LLPMTLFQLVSPTIDGITGSLMVLTLSIFFHACNPTHRFTLQTTLVWSVAIFLVVTSRTNLLPIIGLPFFIAWRRRSYRELWLAIAITLISGMWILYALTATASDPRVSHSITTSELIRHYLAHPEEFFSLLVGTLTEPGVAMFYLRSFIGILGWLDTLLPLQSYLLLSIGLVACALASVPKESSAVDGQVRIFLLSLSVTSFLLIFFALLITWTPHPTSVIKGVQGRYFVGPALIAAYAIDGALSFNRPYLSFSKKFVVLVFAAVSLSALITTLLQRYH
jgi:uncharacterized membrane protein